MALEQNVTMKQLCLNLFRGFFLKQLQKYWRVEEYNTCRGLEENLGEGNLWCSQIVCEHLNDGTKVFWNSSE